MSGWDYGASAQEGDLEDGPGGRDDRCMGARLGCGPHGGGARRSGFELAAIETSLHAVDLFEWQPRFPVCVAFGNEVEGLRPELLEMADAHVRIPMLGQKESLNVATAGGIVLYELLRKFKVSKFQSF